MLTNQSSKIYKTVILLVNYNSFNDTVECLKSIDSIKNDNILVLVIDNGSVEYVNKELMYNTYRYLIFIKNSVNMGFANANNLGLKWIYDNIVCDYIFILNNDTTLLADAIEKLEYSLDNSDNSVALVTPKILVHNNPDEVWYQGGYINSYKMTPQMQKKNASSYTEFASGCAMFFKASYLKELSGFDSFFFMYDEDVELSLRLIKKGYKIIYEPKAIIYHKCQGSQIKSVDKPSNQLHPNHPSLMFYLNNTITNRKYIINKHYVGIRKIKLHIMHATYWVLKCFQYLIYGKNRASLLVIKKILF